MKDIQDGIKVSIQDGVTEDPEFLGSFQMIGKSGLTQAYLITPFTSPKIESVISLEITTPKATGFIFTDIELVVT